MCKWSEFYKSLLITLNNYFESGVARDKMILKTLSLPHELKLCTSALKELKIFQLNCNQYIMAK